MKILQAHNFYQLSGGEDVVVSSEKKLLEEQGHEVITYYKHNNLLKGAMKEKLKLINNTSWSKSTFKEVDELLKREKPDLCHVHNFLPLISPSIYDACLENKVPVVQTLHNYRLICSNGLFLRNGQICEECLTKSPMTSVAKRCYRNSVTQTYMVANMLQKHNRKKTWSTKVDRFICVTEFAKEKFVQHGLPEEKFVVKPNFVSENKSTDEKEDFFLFVGRFEKEKGAELLLKLAPLVKTKIKVIGEGVLAPQLNQCSNIEVLGKKPHAETLKYIAKAKALLFPSILYEGMPMTILEAFAAQTPVIASNIGAMKSLIQHQKTGLLFTMNSVESLQNEMKYTEINNHRMKEISKFALEEFRSKYSAAANYEMLYCLYQDLVGKENEGITNRTLR